MNMQRQQIGPPRPKVLGEKNHRSTGHTPAAGFPANEKNRGEVRSRLGVGGFPMIAPPEKRTLCFRAGLPLRLLVHYHAPVEVGACPIT